MPTTTQPQATGPAAEPSQDCVAFLQALYGAADPGFWFNVTTFPDGRTRPFPAAPSSIAEAAEYVRIVDDGTRHVFTSMALFDRPITRGRGTAADARALTCLWADVDVKAGASPDIATALTIIRAIPLKPTLITCSGTGLHGFWALTEPLSLATEAARLDALDLLGHWKATVMAYAVENGGAVDKGTFDIARVMRVSGTFNPKETPPLAAYIIEHNDVRYCESDFDPILRDAPDTVAAPHVAPVALGHVDLRPVEALPPAFAEALESDTRVRQTWNRSRSDLVDQSSSGYCLALANHCVALGMTDDQVAQVLCTWRYRNDASEKTESWYGRTIARARSGGLSAATAEFVATVETDEVIDTASILDGLSEVLGYRIEAIRRYGGAKFPVYRVKFAGFDEKEIGDADDFIDPRRWAARLLDIGHPMEPVKKPVWRAFYIGALKVIEDVDREEMSERSQAHAWVDSYLEARKLKDDTKAYEAYEHKLPYRGRKDGRIKIFVDDLLRSINKTGQKPIDMARDYNPAMHLLGAKKETADLTAYGIRGKAARIWILPTGYGESVDD